MVKPGNHKLNWIRIAEHFLFWMVSLGFFWLIFSRNSQNKINSAIFIAMLSPIAVFTTYFFNHFLIPKYLFTRKYFYFGWYSIITTIVSAWLALLAGIFIWYWRARFNLAAVNSDTLDVLMLIAALFFVVIMGVAAKLTRYNLIVVQQKEKAEKEILMLDNQLKMNELKLLKDQLNPHFLFNTLNNLYGLTLEKSDKAPDLVMRFSNMLDYMLYRTNQREVPLKQEVGMIENYVTIEKHRFEGKYRISFETKGSYENLQIAPLLLLPLVENCFKHGIRKSIDQPFVEIMLQVQNDIIDFRTSNSASGIKTGGDGIGLANLQKRLEMIYPSKFSFNSFLRDGVFHTSLTINLCGHEV